MLHTVAVQKTRPERIEALRQLNQQVPVIAPLMKYTFDGHIKWLIPEGVPYRPNNHPDQEGNFPREVKNIYLFIEGGHPTISQLKREQMFLRMMESIGAEDALVLLAMKDRRLPFPEIDASLVNEAFPGLLNSLAKPGTTFDPAVIAKKAPDGSVSAYEADFLQDDPIVIPKKTASVPLSEVMNQVLKSEQVEAFNPTVLSQMEQEFEAVTKELNGEAEQPVTTSVYVPVNEQTTKGLPPDSIVVSEIVAINNSSHLIKSKSAAEEIMEKLADPSIPQHLRESLERVLGKISLDKKTPSKVRSKSSKKKPTKKKQPVKAAAKARSEKKPKE